jgi:hypothetical protein
MARYLSTLPRSGGWLRPFALTPPMASLLRDPAAPEKCLAGTVLPLLALAQRIEPLKLTAIFGFVLPNTRGFNNLKFFCVRLLIKTVGKKGTNQAAT